MEKGIFWLYWGEDGNVTLNIENYNFGEGVYQMLYTMNAENAEKMAAILSRTNKGTLEQMIEMEFGIHLDKKNLRKWLDENSIEYKFCSWIPFEGSWRPYE